VPVKVRVMDGYACFEKWKSSTICRIVRVARTKRTNLVLGGGGEARFSFAGTIRAYRIFYTVDQSIIYVAQTRIRYRIQATATALRSGPVKRESDAPLAAVDPVAFASIGS